MTSRRHPGYRPAQRRQADPGDWGEVPAPVSGSSGGGTSPKPRSSLLRPTFPSATWPQRDTLLPTRAGLWRQGPT